MTTKWRKTPYQRIVEAANKGKGVRLSALDVARMSLDEAISMLAENDDQDERRTEYWTTRHAGEVSLQELLAKYGKHCPICGSDRVTSRNEEPRHKCLSCLRRFAEADAIIGAEAAERVSRAYWDNGDRYDLLPRPKTDWKERTK